MGRKEPKSFGTDLREEGCYFSLYSYCAWQRGEAPLLCLNGKRIPLASMGEGSWRVFVPSIKAGQHYTYEVAGVPGLLDPYSRGVQFQPNDNEQTTRENPTSVVVDESFDWQGDIAPNIPWGATLIYETHLKGLSKQHPEVPQELRGTYLGATSEPVLHHLRSLGVSAVEFLPLHASVEEPHLRTLGLKNYWGYNSLSYFALHPGYSSQGWAAEPSLVLREFKEMVKRFHRVGIEVILDVVYNHSAEGGANGPTYSLRGIDEATYYRLKPTAQGVVYEDFTGCGNTLNVGHPRVQQLILDSLRFLAGECHVDGFRLDLASALGRGKDGMFREESPLLHAMLQDPLLAKCKIIAEPWDATAEGYQLGNFPLGMSEWNANYRDTVRRYWRGDAGMVPSLATALSGSSNLFSSRGRSVRSSLNFVTAHDGFTLFDLVSYQQKHNEANGEQNRDGTTDNHSANYGVEGPSEDPELSATRLRQMKNMLGTLMFSLGTPMLLGGDEGGRTQLGNNNAYCQDSPISWFDWERMKEFSELREFISYVAMIRKESSILQRQTFLKGASSTPLKADVLWLDEFGAELKGEAWSLPERKLLQVYLSSYGIRPTDSPGSPGDFLESQEGSETLLLLLNPEPEPKSFFINPHLIERTWRLLLRTDEPTPFKRPLILEPGAEIEVGGQTLMVFRGVVR